MTGQKYGVGGTAALVVSHCAGMLDLIALPVWVGALVERFGFSPRQAGGLVTLFLLGAVAASVVVAPRLNKINQKIAATLGYGAAALAFFAASTQSGYIELAALHLVAGFSVGAALSMVHGAIGKSVNPHRLYALAGISIGLLGIVLLGALPQLMIAFGGPMLFRVFGCVMAVACLTCAIFFINPARGEAHGAAPLGRAVWFTIFGISIMTFNQAMVFSFVEVIGKLRDFPPEGVLGALIALGVVNFIVPSPLAAILQKRLAAERVVQIGPAVQALFAVIVTSATAFVLWAPVAAFFVAIQIFTHTFAFGLLARLDPTGRAVAATPAMLMIGAALGPIVGGALGQNFGFGALGAAAVLVSVASTIFFSKARTA
jgi:predicted MFS family arabinose efflux permease